MKQTEYRIVENLPLARDVFRMRLAGDSSAFTAPGQFLNLRVEGCYLRRPISVCDWDREGVTIIYKVVGKGTAAMSRMGPGEALDALTGLGNGFSPEKGGAAPLLIGGGVGVPPLYRLCRELIARGAHPTAVLGFGSAADVFYCEEFEALGAQVRLAPADGSAGQRGFVTGAAVGFVYMVLGYSVYWAFHGSVSAPLVMLGEMLLGAVLGALSGAVVANLRPKKRRKAA